MSDGPDYLNRKRAQGYKDRVCLVLDLGLCRPAAYPVPAEDILLSVRDAQSDSSTGGNTRTSATISLFGISYFKVHQIAAEIARYKLPEAYSGKGINYDGQKCFFQREKKNERKN